MEKIMTEEEILDPAQICKKEELDEMFNEKFLPFLQKFAKRTKEIKYTDTEMAFYNVRLILQFSELEDPLIYEELEKSGKIQLQLQPVTEEELLNAKQEEEKGKS